MSDTNQRKALFEELIKELVDHPGEVVINAVSGTQSTILEVTVAKADVRRIIGKKGATANSIRDLLNCWTGMPGSEKFRLEIVEPEVMTGPTPDRHLPREEPMEHVVQLLSKLVQSIVDAPDQVTVKQYGGGPLVLIEIKVADDDIRRVIGRRGKTADALRHLLSSMAGRHQLRTNMDVVEPRKRSAAPRN